MRRNGQTVQLEPKIMQVLLCLAKSHGQVVNREELIRSVWADTFVSDDVLTRSISVLRKVLDDDSRQPRFIETIPRSGYRLIGPISFATEVTDKVGEGNPTDTESLFVDRGNHLSASSQKGNRCIEQAACVPKFELVTGHGRADGRPFSAVRLLVLTVVGLGIAFGFGAWKLRSRLPQSNSRTPIRSLAVLPLENLTGDPSQEYFADGMTESLITELGRISTPRVISRQSVMQYKASKKSLREIAGELKVDAILEGAVERSGDRVRVTIHLSQAFPERQLWAQEYDRSIRDILSLQGEIAHAVTDEIQVKLTPEEQTRLTSARPVDPEAHDYYLRGRYLLGLAPAHHSKLTDERQYTETDIQVAIGHFKRAIEKDPAYASAYAGLADAYILLGNPVWGGHSPKETLSDARVAATKALELDPSLAEAHFSLAQTLEYAWNWSEAEKEYRLALKLNPNYADTHLQYGRFVQALKRNDEAMTHMNHAIELDPFSIKTRVVVAYVTYASRQYDPAVKQFESLGDDWGLIWAYREKEIYPEAIAAWQRWKLSHRSQRRCPQCLATLAGIYGLQGRKREAKELIDELRETARHHYVSGFFFAEAYVGLGEKDQALTWLERAYEEHDQWMVFINSYPGLDRLRSEPRFQALLRLMNFPQ